MFTIFSSIETFIKFQFSCCGGVFGCVQCHNEVQSHRAKRKDLEAVICTDCKHQQDGMTNICSQCDTKFGEVRNFLQIHTYSGGNSCCNKALFMKQKCQIHMGVGEFKNAAIPLRTRGINSTHQHFQMRYITLIYLKALKSYQPPNFKCVVSVVKQTLHFYFNQ